MCQCRLIEETGPARQISDLCGEPPVVPSAASGCPSSRWQAFLHTRAALTFLLWAPAFLPHGRGLLLTRAHQEVGLLFSRDNRQAPRVIRVGPPHSTLQSQSQARHFPHAKQREAEYTNSMVARSFVARLHSTQHVLCATLSALMEKA